MILHKQRSRPIPWRTKKQSIAPRWVTPFIWLEWIWEWVAFGLANWTFIEVLEYLETFSVLVAIVFYFAESGDRTKQRHYQAWQVINTAQGKGGSGGRIEALQELNADRIPLVGVDVSSAFLQGLDLRNAGLLRSDFSSTDLRKANLAGADFTLANLNSANLRNANLDRARFVQADLSQAALDDADLRRADLKGVQWQHAKSVKGANIAGVRNAPSGFAEWALRNGAIDQPDAEE